ncbi:MAG: hypothetical protein KDJ65_00380 [Anaerolineae bacterium]|nr:hypothetical protein [Anaerolineae bacterium]
MSCEYAAGRIARLRAGIGQLASKRGFYAGLALGGLGLVSAGLVALARRRSDPTGESPLRQQPALIDPNQVPQLPARTQIAPARALSAAERCQTCQTPARSKQGPWYSIGGRSYCQDCAPAAARQADIDLLLPATSGQNGTAAISNVSAGGGSSRVKAVQAGVDYLSPERRVETRLVESRIGLNVGNANEPALFVVDKAYVLLRPDGSDTGLALTPNLKAETGADGQAVIREDTGQWWITHIPSGRVVTDQAYGNLETAHMLGSILAQMDWTRDETEFSTADYRRASATITFFNQSLAEAKQEVGQGNRALSGQPMKPSTQAAPSVPTGTRRLPDNESLAGRLVADGYGGVSRVLEDNGDKLFLIDSLGKRYEIYRQGARTPDESDFEMCRVAMSFDPARQPEASCGACRRSTKDTGAGEMWYKMGWQAFCEGCATEYAANEGYIKEEEIDEHMMELA